MATDGLNDLLADLRAEGEVDSQGRFTLDRAQARAKLQKFQLSDARRYVLELVQAAVLRGATRIAFDIDADDMRMRFDGRVFTPAELDDLWGSIFADGDSPDLRGLRQLALGLNAALGTNPKRIVVRSGATQIRLQPGREDEIAAIEPAIAETTIHVEQRLGLVLIVEFLRNLTGRLGEEVYLRERCCYAAVPITLDGKPITHGLRIAEAIASRPIVGPGVEGVIGLFGHATPAELRLVKDGVWIDSHPLERCGDGLVAVVVGEQLRKDVSLAKIVADESLAQIVGLARVERWGLFAVLVERVERGELARERVMARVRAEAMEFLKLRLIRKNPEAAKVARAIVFSDARTLDPSGDVTRRWISLVDLAETIGSVGANKSELRYAYLDYPLLRPEGPPIPKLIESDAKALARMFACSLLRVDDELERATQRERARRAWLTRTMDAKLPEHRRYLIRAPIEAPGLRGELGIAVQDAQGRVDGTIWLLREGCLLSKLELAWGIPALDVVVEGLFEPTDSYEDVIHDRQLVRACMLVLAALATPLAQLVTRSRGGRASGGVGVLVEGWLLLVLDPAARMNLLWHRLGVPNSECDSLFDSLVPSAAQVRAGAGPLAAFLDLALFEDFDGTPRSLRELIERCDRVGAIDELDSRVAQVPGLGREIAWLDQGDRWMLIGLFGESALRSWQPTLTAKQREQEFWAKPARTFAAITRDIRVELQVAGVDPELWSRTIETAEVSAVITLGHGIELGRTSVDPELLRGAKIDLLVEGRALTTRVFELGIGPIVGVAQCSGLRATADWSDVEDDDALRALTELLREAAWGLVGNLVLRFSDLFRERRWLATMLLHRLAQSDGEGVAIRLPELPKLPLLGTLDGGSLSLVELDAVIRQHGHIEWVEASTPGAGIRNPPMLREEPLILAALRELVGTDKLVEGGDRLRRHGLSTRLESLPRIDRIELEPRSVWFAVPLGQPAKAGEIGLSRERTSGGLALELCTLGRRLGVIEQADLPAPLEAILDDPELPLLGDGSVDTRSRRYSQHLRRCRRAIPGLIVTLCKRFSGLPQADRERARELLLGYAQAESAAGPGRREARESAWEAVRALPLIVDIWGEWHSLATIEARSKGGKIDVVEGPVEVDGSGSEIDRLILIVDGPARRCLATSMTLRDLDERWEQERAALRELAGAPEFELPDLREVAWIHRKATVAGGLEAHLWIPRTPSESDVLVFTRGRKRVGALAVIPGVACAGVVSGPGLVVGDRGVELDTRQRSSLAKQICVLYEALAKQVESGGRLNANEREQALAWLVGVDAAFRREGNPLLDGLGKPRERLLAALDEIISPALRRAMARARGAEPAQPKPDVVSEPVAAAVVPVQAAAVEAVVSEPLVIDPESALLNSIRAELEWARARHGALLDRLGLDRLRFGAGKPGIAVFERGIVLQRQHPLIARQLAKLGQGRDVDPIDLAFLVSGVFTLMNAVAEEIDAQDERAFVGHMAESLALGLGLAR